MKWVNIGRRHQIFQISCKSIPALVKKAVSQSKLLRKLLALPNSVDSWNKTFCSLCSSISTAFSGSRESVVPNSLKPSCSSIFSNTTVKMNSRIKCFRLKLKMEECICSSNCRIVPNVDAETKISWWFFMQPKQIRVL